MKWPWTKEEPPEVTAVRHLHGMILSFSQLMQYRLHATEMHIEIEDSVIKFEMTINYPSELLVEEISMLCDHIKENKPEFTEVEDQRRTEEN